MASRQLSRRDQDSRQSQAENRHEIYADARVGTDTTPVTTTFGGTTEFMKEIIGRSLGL